MHSDKEITYEVKSGEKIISFKTGKLAKQANCSMLVESGGNGVLITATMSDSYKEDIDFFPLMIDVEEKMYAAGKIPGGFFKREGRASEKAILNSRLTDRPIRPIFNKDLRNDVQVIATVLSVDQVYPYDILVMNGASCALYASDIPFYEPVGAVRIGYYDEKWFVNPSNEDSIRFWDQISWICSASFSVKSCMLAGSSMFEVSIGLGV